MKATKSATQKKNLKNNNVAAVLEEVKVTALAVIQRPMIPIIVPQTEATATQTEAEPQPPVTVKTPLAASTEEKDLDITTVFPNTYNPRKTFEKTSMQELADSIREVGILHAIAVRPCKEGTGYEIIYGERRYRASLLIGAKTIKAVIHSTITDEEAEDMSITENLQRKEVRPTEEAAAFKQLLDKGRYDMYSLVSRFGRSEKYIYTRLKLNELYQPIAELLDKDVLSIAVAEEISTYEASIQQDIYENHLKDNCKGDDWTGYNFNLFKKHFEKAYTTDLEQYKFDKIDCKACAHNAANYNLFAEYNGCGHCTDRKCLEAKNTAYVAKEAEKLLQQDPKLTIVRTCYGNNNATALEKLDKKGHEIKELSYSVSARNFPQAPEAPTEKAYSDPKEYEQAVETFEQKQQTYTEQVEELSRKQEEGRIKTYVKVGQTGPSLCYVEVNKKEAVPVNIDTLKEKDKRFKEIAVEKIVADTKKLVTEYEYPESPFTQYEDGMMYFIMLSKLQRKNYPFFGIKDALTYMDEKQKMKIVSKLTDAQRTLIKRDFILYHLCESGHGDNNASKLLRDFANMHFPDQYGLAKATHEEEYQKRHERLEEKIKELKKAEKAAAKKAEQADKPRPEATTGKPEQAA